LRVTIIAALKNPKQTAADETLRAGPNRLASSEGDEQK
jgi:hypothetical protein